MFRNKGCSKNQVELIFDFLEMNFCKFRQSHSPLCSFLNSQKGALRSQPKRKHFLLNISYPVIYRTPHKPFPGRNRILSANSSSVKPQRLSRSRWRIHRATIERFISVYRLEENGSLLKVPLSGCIHRKAINRNKPFPGRNRILSVNSSSAKPQRLSRSKAE